MKKSAKVTLGILGLTVTAITIVMASKNAKKTKNKPVKLEFPEGWDMATNNSKYNK